jgi:hypothetical protein
MNEAEWDQCSDPRNMLEFLRDSGKASDRKLRLFVCGCCRRMWRLLRDERGRQAVEVAEQVVDGAAGAGEVASAARNRRRSAALSAAEDALDRAAEAAICLDTFAASHYAAFAAATAPDARGFRVFRAVRDAERAAQAVLLRDIFGPLPFRPVHTDPSLLTKHDGLIRKLGQAAYDHRDLPSGALDGARLLVLADALEEAGLTGPEVLSHLRSGGPHIRGCWAVDAILGKS